MRLSQFQFSVSGTEVNYLPLVNLANLPRYVELIYRKNFLLPEFLFFFIALDVYQILLNMLPLWIEKGLEMVLWFSPTKYY